MSTWTLPTFDRIAEPKDLADVVIDFRRFTEADTSRGEPGPPSDSRLLELIQIAFQASLVAEEGRYSRARIFVYRGGGWQPKPTIVAELDARILANEDGVLMLKRLAPIADSLDSTLVLEEESEGLRCVGLATVSEPIYPVQIGRPELHQPQAAPAGLSVRIDGPGVLRATYMSATFVLDGGRIRQAVELFVAPPISELLYRIDLALTQGTEIPRFAGINGRTHQLGLPINFALSRIVAKMREAGRGGALIFPSEKDSTWIEAGVFKTRVTGLGDALHSFYASSLAAGAAKAIEEFRSALAQRQNALQMILRFADCVASLSRVDGCVVLEPNLDVVAFGAKIKAPSQSEEKQAALTLANPFTKEPVSDSDIWRFGTRHRSAYILCGLLPGTTAIVVSQDGDIRVFSSDSKHLYFVDSLEASSIGLPLF